MIGRTSGHQGGLVKGMCEDVLGTDGVWRLCSARADYVSGSGDSGAPIVSDNSGVVIARGVHWGSQSATVKFFSLHSSWDSELREDFGGTFDVTAPPPPFTVSIDGPSVVSPMASCTWDAAPSGGTPPYHSYQWSGVLSGTSSSVTGSVFSSDWLYLSVKDSSSPQQTAYAQKYITVDWGAPPACE